VSAATDTGTQVRTLAWRRVRVVVPWVGAGRLLGRGEVFDAGGSLAVTFATWGLLRAPRLPV
jgi:hypothetical protein